MSRKRSRKVLYEVSTEARKARKSGPKLEISKRLRAFSNKVESRRVVKKTGKAPNTRPRGIKRVIFVLVAVLLKVPVKKALVLLVIFAAVVFFWPFGVKNGMIKPESDLSTVGTVDGADPGGSGGSEIETSNPDGVEGLPEVAGPPKDHCILIASCKDVEQLEPVAKFFLENGYETEFKTSGNWYTLITKDRYLSTRDPQSKANMVKKEIIEIGDEYKPPAGFGSFTFDSVLIKKVSGE